MKKLINKPEDVVREELEGIVYAHSDLVKVHYDPNFIVRADAPIQGKVGVISGGGSGHEPMIVMAITSLALAILIAWQVIPNNGWLEGIGWGLLFGAMIWAIFFGNLWISKKLRK